MATTNAPTDWQTKVTAKRAAEHAKIPSEWLLPATLFTNDETSPVSVLHIPRESGILNPLELSITEDHTAISLAAAVQTGTLKALDVATAFCKRAAIAQQLTNCLTETMFADALARGKFLDDYLAANGQPLGPLHGVPVSLKDPFAYVGVASTIGFTSFLDNPLPMENAPLVKILLSLGAILYCKTNIPQTMMTADSHNNVFGRVLNPHNLTLTAGGSSGGEGALVAMRGSILGVGTDIGGSIRIPAICCGTYGFKPSSNRVPYGGQTSPGRPGTPAFPAVAGPLATSFEDLEFFAHHVLAAKPWNFDASALAIPWRHDTALSAPTKLRIGYISEDPDFPVHPPVARALETSAKKLAASGIEIVPLTKFPSFGLAMQLSADYFSLDNSKTPLVNISQSGEPMIPSLVKTLALVNKQASYTLDEVFALNVARSAYKTAWNQVFVEAGVDVVLCPGAGNTAVAHDSYGAPPYTVVWNLLEYPGIIIPVGKADKKIDRQELAVDNGGRAVQYNAEEVHGAPTTIQLAARAYMDEELVAAARVVDACLRG